MKNKTLGQCQDNKNARSFAAAAMLLAGVALAGAARAEEVTFTGGSPVLPQSGTINIATPGSVPCTYSYTDPATGQTVAKTLNMGAAVIPYMTMAFANNNNNVTVKAAGDGGMWAQLSGNNTHQLISVNESTTHPTTMTFEHVIFTKGRPASGNGGALRIIDDNEGKKMTLLGDMVFLSNISLIGNGGAVQSGKGTLEFGGNVAFIRNLAGNGTGTTGNGGAINFMGTPSTADGYEALIFRKDAIFVSNTAGGQGGGIYVSEGVSALKGVEFYGLAVFEGNTAGAASTGQYHGGAIAATGNGSSVISFYNSVSFKRNSASGSGGAIANRSGNVIFADTPGFTGNKSFVFERNVAMAMTTAAYWGGGAIYTDNNNSSVYFLSPDSTLSMTGNVALPLWTGAGSISGNNASGGAIRAHSGVYLLAGAFAFTGNQAVGNGGAIYIHTGNMSTGYAFRDHGILYDGAADTYKYRVQIAANATFTGNLAGGNGGAIYAFTSAASNMYFGGNTKFTNNATRGRGGAIYLGGTGTNTLAFNADSGDILFSGNRHQVTFAYTGANTAFTRDDANTILAATSGSDGYMRADMGTGGANDIYFNGNAALELNAETGRTISFAGGVAATTSGNITGSLVKTGAGTVVFCNGGDNLNGTNMLNTGVVKAGAFILENSNYGAGNPGSTFTIQGTGTLGGWGIMKDKTIAQAGATIEVGLAASSTAQKLTFGAGLDIQGGVTLRFDLLGSNGAANTYDNIAVTGAFNATGNNTIDITGMGTGSYTLVASTGALTANPLDFNLLSYGAALTLRNQGSTIGLSGNNLLLNAVMQNLATTWDGGALWQDAQGTAWRATLDNNEKYFRNNDSVTFTDTGAGSIAIAEAGVRVSDMTVNSAADYTFTGTAATITTSTSVAGASLTGVTRKLTKQGAGTLTFENASNTFAGGIDIDAGTVGFNKAAQLTTSPTTGITFTGNAALKANADAMTLANNIAISAGKTATLALGANNLTYTGTLTAADTAATLAKTGVGQLTLTTDNSAYTGKTDIAAGALHLATSGAKLGGDITLATGATLSGIGAAGNVTADAGSLINVGNPGATAPQILTMRDLTMNGATLRVNLYDNLSAADSVTLTGAWHATAAANTLDIATLKVGTYNLGNIGAFADQAWTVTIAGQSQAGSRQTAGISNVSGNLILNTTADASRSVAWTGASGTWNISAANWDTGVAAQTYAGGDSVTFGDAGATRTVVIEGAANVTDMHVGASGDYTFTGGAINADAAFVMPTTAIVGPVSGKLFKSGAGTLTFENSANNFAGGIDIDGGAIVFNKAAQLGTPAAITFTNTGTLKAGADGMTLATKIAIAAAATGAIDTAGNNMRYTGTLAAADSTSTFAKDGAGTLLLSANNSAYAGHTKVNAGALLLDSATSALGGDLTIASGAAFGGSGTFNGNIAAQANSEVHVGGVSANGAGKLTVTGGAITLAGSSTLTGSGTLASALSLGASRADNVYANIAAGANLSLTGTSAGLATLVKQGSGTLTLTGTGAVRYAATQIDQGVVALTGISETAAALVSQTITLNGGWISLSNTAAAAASWNQLVFVGGANASAGGIIGNNSQITLGSGTAAFNIGAGSDPHANGHSVTINPGANKATVITGNNAYTGITIVQSGTLVISKDSQLGDVATAALVRLAGGSLRVTGTAGTNLLSTRNLAMQNASSGVFVDAGVESTWNRLAVTGTGLTFTKSGGGVLNFNGNGTFDRGAINLEGGTLGILANTALGADIMSGPEQDATIVHRNAINVTGADAALRFGNNVTAAYTVNLNGNTLGLEALSSDSATFGGAITGAGGIDKIGTGAIILTGTGNNYQGATKISAGILRAGALGALPSASAYTIERNGTLDFNGFAYTVAAINNKGVLSLAKSGTASIVQGNHVVVGNYNGEPGSKLYLNWGISDNDFSYKLKSDLLTITGAATGDTEVVLINKGDLSMPNKIVRRGADISDLKFVSDGVQAGAVFTGTFAVNTYKYEIKSDEYGDIVFTEIGLIDEAQATIAIDAQALFIGNAALETLGHRFAALRTETSPRKRGFDVWLAGIYREDRVRGDIYDGAKNTISGVQLGADFIDATGDTFFVLGGYVDTMASTMKLAGNNAKTDADILGAGVYGGMRAGPWYLEATMRASKDDYRVSTPVVYDTLTGILRAASVDFTLPGSSFGGMLEAGYIFSGSPSGWVFEPQGQILLHRSTIDPTFDPNGNYYKTDTIQSTAGRVGLKLSKAVEFSGVRRLTWYTRASILHEFSGQCSVMVNECRVEDDLSGDTAILDLGASMRLSQRFYLNADATYRYGSKYDGYSLNLGACFNW